MDRRGRPRRHTANGEINRDEIVGAAFAVLRHSGSERLTMAAVAREIDVPVMTLYGYVRSKDELMELLATRVTEALYDHEPTENHDGWRDVLRTHAIHLRKNLLAQPGYAVVIFEHGRLVDRRAYTRAVGAYLNDAIRALCTAGMTLEHAGRAVYSLSTVTLSLVQRETSLPSIPTDRDALMDSITPESKAELSVLAEALPYLRDDDHEAHFDFAVEALLDGFDAIIERDRTYSSGGEPRTEQAGQTSSEPDHEAH